MVTSGKKEIAIVLYEDGCPEIERIAREVAERIGEGGREARLRAASSTTIPDILAADLYVFGAESSEAPSYLQVARVLSGINLAGRRALFFGASGAAVAHLRAICSDTEVSAARADLVTRRIDGPAIAAWLRDLG